MNHLKFKKFALEAKKLDVEDALLNRTFNEFINLDEKGRQKSSLGAGLYKIRIATAEGRGKSAGSRSIVVFRNNDRMIWLHLFPKNIKDNVTTSELSKLKKLSGIMLNLSDCEIKKLLDSGYFCEVSNNE